MTDKILEENKGKTSFDTPLRKELESKSICESIDKSFSESSQFAQKKGVLKDIYSQINFKIKGNFI